MSDQLSQEVSGVSVQVSVLTPDTGNLKPQGEQTMRKKLVHRSIGVAMAVITLGFAVSA